MYFFLRFIALIAIIWKIFNHDLLGYLGENKKYKDIKTINSEKIKLRAINQIKDLRNIRLLYYKLKNDLFLSNNFSNKSFKKGDILKVIRSFNMKNISYYIVVDTKTLNTFVINTDNLSKNSEKIKGESIKKTRLYRLLKKYKQTVIKKIAFKENFSCKQFALTIDMCSSSSVKNLKWERKLFDWIVELSDSLKRTIPISLAVTNAWIYHNASKFKQLIEWKKEKKIEIIWINHSSNHELNFNKNSKMMFLTHSKVNFDIEVSDVEKILLEQNQVPSILFRFPGLTYNNDLLLKLHNLSLIAVDSDTWINKGEKIHNGSIILIHGNGNEHSGIIKYRKKMNILQNACHDSLASMFLNIVDFIR